MKRITAIFLAIFLLLSLTACMSNKQTGALKEITFEVTHADGSVKEFSIQTDAETLAEALTKEGLIVESAGSAGLYDVIDGEKADWNDGEAWWCISKDGTPLSVGMKQTPLADGDHFEAVFTRGYDQ